MKNLFIFLSLILTIIVATNNANAFTARQTYDFGSNCRFVTNDPDTHYMFRNLNETYIYSHNRSYLFCKLPHEFNVDSSYQYWQYNQDIISSIIVNYDFLYSTDNNTMTVCEVKNTAFQSLECGDWISMPYSSNSTTIYASNFPLLDPNDGAIVLVLKFDSSVTTDVNLYTYFVNK